MKTALVIEDDENNMVLITRLLEKSGFRTITAETGRQGFDLALDKKPDFIILDINLPDIDGAEVLKKIRASDMGSSVHVIVMTSFAMTGDREKYCAAGCDGYIEKPIDPHTVISQIRQIIGE